MHVPTIQRVETSDEIDAVAALAHEIWNEHFPPIIGQAKVDYMLGKFQSAGAIAEQIRSEGYEYYLARHQAENVGYFAIVPDVSEGSMLLSKIYVKRALRGLGLGRALLDRVEVECASRGIQKLRLSVNKGNAGPIAFYEREGFIIVDATVTDIGCGFVMDDYTMAKQLG